MSTQKWGQAERIVRSFSFNFINQKYIFSSSSLQVHRLFQWADCQKYPPFAELASIKSQSNSLLQNQFVILRNVQPIQNAAYFFLINTFSPMFVKLCKRMKEEEQVKKMASKQFNSQNILGGIQHFREWHSAHAHSRGNFVHPTWTSIIQWAWRQTSLCFLHSAAKIGRNHRGILFN